jgi:hypothetical protein
LVSETTAALLALYPGLCHHRDASGGSDVDDPPVFLGFHDLQRLANAIEQAVDVDTPPAKLVIVGGCRFDRYLA